MSNNHKTRYVNSLVHRQIHIRGSWAISDRVLERAGLRGKEETYFGDTSNIHRNPCQFRRYALVVGPPTIGVSRVVCDVCKIASNGALE